jgi:transcriptional regulator with XRE-family HTH domain
MSPPVAPLSELRTVLTDLSQAQLAAEMGVRQERVSMIERGSLGSLRVSSLISYVEALGGQLTLTAVVDGVTVTLRTGRDTDHHHTSRRTNDRSDPR